MVTAVLSDYAHPVSRGRISGLVGLAAGLGALLGVFGFLPLANRNKGSEASIKESYWVVAGVSLLVGISILFLLRKPSSEQAASVKERGRLWFFSLARDGITACRDPRVLLAYVAGFVVRIESTKE